MAATGENDLFRRAEDIAARLAGGATLRDVADIGDDELEAVYAAAHGQFAARKYDKAADLFKFLCLYDHTEPRWFYGLGVVQQEKKDYAGAISAYGVATILDVDDPRPQIQAGYCLMAMNRWPEAESALEGAILTCGDDPASAGIRKQAEALLASVQARKPAVAEKKGRK